MNRPNLEVLRKHVAESAETGKLGDLEIEFWRGGGLPPPHYQSTQLRLLRENGVDVVVFANLIFDAKLDPPDVQEKWTVPVDPADVKSIARLLLQSGVVAPEPVPKVSTPPSDTLKTELLVTVKTDQIKKAFGPTLPPALAELEELFQKLIAGAKSKGRKALFHLGKKLD